MYIVTSYNEMIALDASKDAVCTILVNGKLEDGPVYKYDGQSWIQIKFYGLQDANG